MSNCKTPELPKLREVPEVAETPIYLRKLLHHQDLDLDDRSFSGSELSDPFYELHKDSFLSRAKGEKAISKKEADRLTMAHFTEDFKKTMKEVRKELQISDLLMLETEDNIKKAQQRNHVTLMDSAEILNRRKQILEDSVTSDPVSLIKGGSCDTDSGVWRMLSANCAEKKFAVTPPHYNIYKEEQPYWLIKPAIPWQVLDHSKRKCEMWLNKYHK
ncbi:hypothetical protein FQA39_LY01886 [Lamprigera yunnana]|nr:hypothetical protein FQA39_LY01886 [Lamprigera yunnana]